MPGWNTTWGNLIDSHTLHLLALHLLISVFPVFSPTTISIFRHNVSSPCFGQTATSCRDHCPSRRRKRKFQRSSQWSKPLESVYPFIPLPIMVRVFLYCFSIYLSICCHSRHENLKNFALCPRQCRIYRWTRRCVVIYPHRQWICHSIHEIYDASFGIIRNSGRLWTASTVRATVKRV